MRDTAEVVSGMWGFLRRHIALVALGMALIIAMVGSVAFFLALRPCVLEFRSGERVHWQLVQTITPLDADGQTITASAVTTTGDLDLLCLGPGNECALITPGDNGTAPEIRHLRFGTDGRCRRYADDGSLLDDGFALDFFDLNLLRLPPGSDQEWRVEVSYASLPPGARSRTVTVRRVRNGLYPEFLMAIPDITWSMPPAPATDGAAVAGQHYEQISDLSCLYRFNPDLGVVDQMVFSCRFRVEMPPPGGIRSFAVEAHLSLVGHQTPDASAPDRILLARALLRLQRALEEGRRSPEPDEIDVVAASRVADGPYRQLADLLLARVPQGPATAGGGWVLRVACTESRYGDRAEALKRSLLADGFPAFTRERDGKLFIYVGPYPQKDAQVKRHLGERFQREDPFWVPYE